MKTKLPEFVPEEEREILYQDVRDLDSERKQANKDYIDQKFHTRDKNVSQSDLVLLEKKKENKLSPAYEREPYEVVKRQGDQVVLRSTDGVEYKRNLQHIKPFVKPCVEKKTPDPQDEKSPTDLHIEDMQQEKRRRSDRVTRKPEALRDFVWV